MPDSLARAQLARTARQLRGPGACFLPPLVFLTDDERLPDPMRAVRLLPEGSLVVVRSRDEMRRRLLADLVRRWAREHRLVWSVADDPELARRAGADGAHFPATKIPSAARYRTLHPSWFITCSAHSPRDCPRADRAGASAVLLAPVLATNSHPGAAYLGHMRTRLIALAVPVPIYVLGGIDHQTARRFVGARLAGFAAIGGLAPGEGESAAVAPLPRQPYKPPAGRCVGGRQAARRAKNSCGF